VFDIELAGGDPKEAEALLKQAADKLLQYGESRIIASR